MKHHPRWGTLLLALALLSGCGGPRTYPVSGTVKLDGKPLDEGTIFLSPPEAGVGTQADSAPVKAGKFQLQSHPGKNRVEVRAMREVPGRKSPFGGPLTESIIPEQYNAKTILSAEVTPDGQNHFEFDLKLR